MCFVFTSLLVFLTFLNRSTIHSASAKDLALWIDENQVKQFVGIPMDIYVIRDGAVVAFLLSPYFEQQLPVIPAEINLVDLTWQAGKDLFYYKFTQLQSLDPHIMYSPLLSVPSSGIIPHKKDTFQMAIPCTGKVEGIASLLITMYIHDYRGYRIRGSPLRLKLKKQCFKFDMSKMCRHSCQNKGLCNEQGICECKPGYEGHYCERAICDPLCLNNGTCITPGICRCNNGFIGEHCEINGCKTGCKNSGKCVGIDKCLCLRGYTGVLCEIPICRKPCGAHGVCKAADKCRCNLGWYGRTCQRQYMFSDGIPTETRKARRRRRRKSKRYIRMLRNRFNHTNHHHHNKHRRKRKKLFNINSIKQTE